MKNKIDNPQNLASRPTIRIVGQLETQIEELQADVGGLIEESEGQKALIVQLEEQLKAARDGFFEIEAQIETANDKICSLRENQDIFVQGAELKAQLAQLRSQLPETLWTEFDSLEAEEVIGEVTDEEDIDNFGSDDNFGEIETDTEPQQPVEVITDTERQPAEVETLQQDNVATPAKHFPDNAEAGNRGWELVKVSDRVAYFLKPDDSIHTTYVGFRNKKVAESWGRYLTTQLNVADGFEPRSAQRIEGFKHEIKIWGIKGIGEIEKLAASDLTIPPKTKSYRSAKDDASNDNYDIGEFIAITDEYWGIYHFGNFQRAKEIGVRLFALTQTNFDIDEENGDLLLPTPTLEDGEDWQRQIQDLLIADAREVLPTELQPANVAANDLEK